MKKLVMPLVILCFALLLCLIACDFGGNNSNNANKVDFLPYEIDNTGCIKRFYANESNSINIVIPSTYNIDKNGKIVSGKAYEVKTIGNYCFANNNLIESVYIPESITVIEDCAFYNCAKLNTVNITQNITDIGQNAFELCPQLKSITKDGKTGVIIDTNKNLTSFIIPSSISKIENNCFANWSTLLNISIENEICYIGDNAFSNCNNLSRVNIASSLNYLGENAFSNCEKLTTLTTTNNNSYNGIYFAPNQSLSKFSVPLSITSIQDEFFYGWKQLKELNIHEAITSLGTIFKDNDNLTSLTCASSNILSLFYSRSNYYGPIPGIDSETMYVVEKKDYYTYNYYIPNTLTEIHLLNSVESYCLYGMKSVQKVYLPSTVSEFGNGAFAGCSGLTNVYFTTDSDWKYNASSYPSDITGIIPQADMNNSIQLAVQLKAHNGSSYRWFKANKYLF